MQHFTIKQKTMSLPWRTHAHAAAGAAVERQWDGQQAHAHKPPKATRATSQGQHSLQAMGRKYRGVGHSSEVAATEGRQGTKRLKTQLVEVAAAKAYTSNRRRHRHDIPHQLRRCQSRRPCCRTWRL